MFDIICIGHITLDKVITPGNTVEMPGGTSYYFSKAIRHTETNYHLITSLSVAERRFVDALRKDGLSITVYASAHSHFFENIYPADTDHRLQRILGIGDPFPSTVIADINARIIHAGPLLMGDIPEDLLPAMAAKGLVSLDVQGYLRESAGQQVVAKPWERKNELLPFIHFMKANEQESACLTGQTDPYVSAAILAEWGVKEVVITLGSRGSLIYTEGQYHEIPAFIPGKITDATGCGDTYMAGYLSRRCKGLPVPESAMYAAAMATLKIQSSGPFAGDSAAVEQVIHQSGRYCQPAR